MWKKISVRIVIAAISAGLLAAWSIPKEISGPFLDAISCAIPGVCE